MLKDMILPSLPYPKGDNNADYQFGDYLGTEIIDKESGKKTIVPKEVDLSKKTMAQQTYLF